MELETLNALNESLRQNLLTMIEVVVWINILLVIIGFAVYLVGLVRLCFEETRQPVSRRMNSEHELDECDLMVWRSGTFEDGVKSE